MPFSILSLLRFLFQKINVPIYAAYLYDAVTVYARTLDTVLKDGGSADNGTAIIEKIRNTTFTSMFAESVLSLLFTR